MPDVLHLREIYRRKVLNQELSLREYAEKRLVLKSRPSKAIIELTENCNFRCVMCSQSFDPKYKHYRDELNMPLDLFDKVAEAIFPNAYFIDLQGFGESTILPHWPDILDRLEHYPLVNWHLVTNFSLENDKAWEKMVRCGFVLGFSCDAATPETFEAIRVRSRFEAIRHNLELVSNRIEREGHGYLYFIVTVQKRNVHELPAIVELAAKYGVPEVQFKIVRQFDDRLRHDEMVQEGQKEELRQAVTRSLDLALERRLRLTLNDPRLFEGADLLKVRKAASVFVPLSRANFPPSPNPDPGFSDSHSWTELAARVSDTARVSVHQQCFKAHHYTYVARDGRVGTCNHMMNPELLEMGNLNYQSFEEIWNGDDYQVFRKSLVTAQPFDHRCKWCFKHRLED